MALFGIQQHYHAQYTTLDMHHQGRGTAGLLHSTQLSQPLQLWDKDSRKMQSNAAETNANLLSARLVRFSARLTSHSLSARLFSASCCYQGSMYALSPQAQAPMTI